MPPMTTHRFPRSADLAPAGPGSIPIPGTRHVRQELLELYATWFGNLKPATRRAYGEDFRQFTEFMGAASPQEASAELFSGTHGEANAAVFKWSSALKEKGLAPSTIARRLAALRAVNRIFRSVGLVPWTVELPRLRIEKYKDTFGAGGDAVERVLKDLEGKDGPIPARDLAIIALLFEHALRRGEVASLDVEHLDEANGRIWILGKAREKRQAVIPSDRARIAIRRWLAVRGSVPGPLFTALDPGHAGGRLSTTSIYRIVHAYGLKRPHGVRHAGITKVIDETGDLRLAQQFARHKDPKITMRYYDNVRDIHSEAVDRVFNKNKERKK